MIFGFDLSYPLLFLYEVKLTIVAIQSTFKKDKSATINSWQFIRIYERTHSDLRIRDIYIRLKENSYVVENEEKSKEENDLQGKYRGRKCKLHLLYLIRNQNGKVIIKSWPYFSNLP